MREEARAVWLAAGVSAVSENWDFTEWHGCCWRAPGWTSAPTHLSVG